MKTYQLLILIHVILGSCISEEKQAIGLNEIINNTNPLIVKNDCFKNALAELNEAKSNLRKLDSIYSEFRIPLNCKIDSVERTMLPPNFGCFNPEPRRQAYFQIQYYRERIKILDTTYDKKFSEFITILEEDIKAIEKCTTLVGQQDWYNQYGHDYFNQIALKYKRKQS